MALRYAKSTTIPLLTFSGSITQDSGNITDDGLRVLRLSNSWTRMAPSRYSSVQRVVFHGALQWLENNAARNVDVQLLVGPMSTSSSTRVIHAKEFGLASLVKQTVGQTTPWDFEPSNGVNTNFQNTMLYSKRGVRATLNGDYTGIGTERDVHFFTITFDRTDPACDDFWADWDSVAAIENDNAYVGFNVYVGLVESTFVAGSSANIYSTSFGAHVVQAPSAPNNTCTIVDASRLGFYTAGLGVARRTAFSVQPDEHLGRFLYNADEWDGITQIAMWNQGAAGTIAPTGEVRYRVDVAPNPGTAITTLDQQDFAGLTGSGGMDVVRSADVKDLIPDGALIGGDYLFEGMGGDNTSAPLQQLEIVQKSASKTVFYMILGRGPGNPPSSAPTAAGGDYFDPAFFEDFPAFLVGDRRFEGTIRREVMGELTQYFPRSDADLGSFDANPDTSATAISVTPWQVNSSGNDDDDPQVLHQTYPMGDVGDPFDLLLPRKVYLRTSISTSGVNDCGCAVLAYPHQITASPVAPELGPLFETGSFNPEGCASTAAGLGNNPGVLIITNGRTTPKKFDPREGTITNAGMETPYRNEEPTATPASTSLSPDGGLTPGVYTYRYTLRNCCTGNESDPNPVDIVVDGSGESPGLEVTLDFTGVVIPADVQICEICIYRTILGGDFPVMAKVGCFDPDVTSVFVDTLPDDDLDFLEDPLSTFNAPMPCVPIVIEFRNRLLAMGDIPVLFPEGTVSVTMGSDLLEADAEAAFDRCIIGKFIKIAGDCTAYEVLELLGAPPGSPESGVTVVLDREYEGATGSGLSYMICGHPNRIYISEPLEPESWPAVNFLDVDPGDGDRIMGAVANFNRVLVMKRRKTYVLAWSVQPVTEIFVPTLISSDIGCIAPRSVAQVASGSVWLSDRGLALYDGRSVQALPECSVMNDLFVDPMNPNYLRRDANGRALGAAGVFYPKREQYLLLLPTVRTQRGASMILVWDTELRNITLLEFCQEFLSIELARDSDGNERVYLGDTNGFVWIWDVGDTDGVGFPNATGTVRGTVTAAGVDTVSGASFLDDSTASFIVGGIPGLADLQVQGLSGFDGQSNLGLAGVCVFWRPADAPLGTPWQSRAIYAASATRLFVTPGWSGLPPSEGDDYMLGPIRFEAVFKPSNYGTDDFSKRDWRQIIVHDKEQVSTNLRTELLRDFANSDVDEDTVTDASGETGMGRNFDLGFGTGRQIRPVGRLVHQYMGVRLSNFGTEEPLTIINHLLAMNPRMSK